MCTSSSLLGITCRVAVFSFLVAATALQAQAQQATSVSLVSEVATTSRTWAPSSSSSAADTPEPDAGHNLSASAALESSQPPPRRYGRPTFSDKTSNSDGSAKYEFLGGFGMALPLGNTHVYETPNWGLQVGGGRNFNKDFGVILQFDYDHFGLQAATLNNQTYIYNTLLGCSGCVSGLDGNNHVWSFTLNPTFTLVTPGSWNAYAVVGGGFYHKVTNFTQPATQEACSIYGCGYFTVNSNIDHYTSNAGGINGGLGVTCKFSKFSNTRLYFEARYVFVLNQQRNGITAANVANAPASATNFYPANSHRTTYIPIKLGIRF
jgi:hypothetical protein